MPEDAVEPVEEHRIQSQSVRFLPRAVGSHSRFLSNAQGVMLASWNISVTLAERKTRRGQREAVIIQGVLGGAAGVPRHRPP